MFNSHDPLTVSFADDISVLIGDKIPDNLTIKTVDTFRLTHG